MADTTYTTDVHAGLVQRLQEALGGLGQRFARYRLYRRTLSELASMSNRELADLGLHRSEIRRVAYHAAYE